MRSGLVWLCGEVDEVEIRFAHHVYAALLVVFRDCITVS